MRGWPIPVAARSKAWACGRSLGGIAGSKPAGCMDVSFECLCCQVEVSLVDHSFRVVIPSVVCLSVISKPQQWGCLGCRTKKTKKMKGWIGLDDLTVPFLLSLAQVIGYSVHLVIDYAFRRYLLMELKKRAPQSLQIMCVARDCGMKKYFGFTS